MKERQDMDKKIPEFEFHLFTKALKFFEHAIDMLKENISNHKYDIIIGDDVSGRLPAVVLYGVMKKIYSQDNTKAPKLLFFAGDGSLSEKYSELWEKAIQKELSRYLKEGIIKKESKILLVTEYNQTNTTILNFHKVFKACGFNFDVLNLQRNINTLPLKENEIKMYDAGIVKGDDFILFHDYIDRLLTGVKKFKIDGSSVLNKNIESNDDIDDKKNAKEYLTNYLLTGVKKIKVDSYAMIDKNMNRDDIVKTRKDVKTMVEYLTNYYNTNK